MNNDFMDKMKDGSRQMYAPWSRFNQAMLRNAEKMTDFSLETMRHYSEMGLEQLRNVSSVDSPEAASSFNQKQTELLNQLGQKMLSDAQRLTELGNEIRNEVMSAMNEIYSQNASSMQSAASNASKTAEDFNRKVNENMHKAANQMSEAVKQTTQNMNKAATNVNAAATHTTNDVAQNSEAVKPAARTNPAVK